MKKLSLVLAMLGLLAFAGSASAATTNYKGQPIDYTGTVETKTIGDSGDFVLIFKSSGTLTLPSAAKANILVVGGGGSGASGGSSNPGGGGSGGGVVYREAQSLSATSYSITVGTGGTKVDPLRIIGYSSVAGNSGSPSSISIDGLNASGGAGGARQSSSAGSGQNVSYDITGESVIYSVGASGNQANPASRGLANTGSGGDGGATTTSSAAGRDGVVVVRLTSIEIPTVNVSLSAGASIPVEHTYLSGTGDTVYSISKDSGSGISAVTTKVSDTVATTTFAADADAEIGSESVFMLKAGDVDIAKYVVTVMLTPIRVRAGAQTGNLGTGKTTAWTLRSDNQSVASIDQVRTGRSSAYTYNYRITGENVGCANCSAFHSEAGHFGYLTRVYDESAQSVQLISGSETNIVVRNVNDMEGFWKAVSANMGVATVALEGAEQLTNEVAATITALPYAGSQSVQTTILVTNEYHVETITVVVSKKVKQTVMGDSLTMQVGDEGQELRSPAAEAKWYASSADGGVAVLKTFSGEAGTFPVVVPKGVGVTTVMVENDNEVFIHTVTVTKKQIRVEAEKTVGVGYAITNSFDSAKYGVPIAVRSDNDLVADARLENGKIVITGKGDGTTEITVETKDYDYIIPVRSHTRDIYKNIELVMGKTTRTTYSYNFDKIVGEPRISPQGYVDVQTEGGTNATFSIAQFYGGEVKIDIECYIDGIKDETSTLHYTVTMRQLSDSEVYQYGDGYVAYGGAPKVEDIGTALVLTFTNVNDQEFFEIPDALTARADILAVGGGGGGGSTTGNGYAAGGGGGGGFDLQTNRYLQVGRYLVSVGAGGKSDMLATGEPGQGHKGGNSRVSSTNEVYAYASADGGGGGGAPAAHAYLEGLKGYDGGDGGSGGGACWYSADGDVVVGVGGRGVNGLGFSGGSPATSYFCGGGGGGAGGIGGGDMSRGAGRIHGISGSDVTYAEGGQGGQSGVNSKVADHAGVGFGGDGANGLGGLGGNGSDGIVIVRVNKLYRDVLVPIPTTNADDIVTARFQWTSNTTFKALNYTGRSFRSPSNKHPYNWEDVIDRVDGETSVDCYWAGTNKVGLGYYNFTIWLKDGFAWDVGTKNSYGNIGGMRYRWAVREDISNEDAEIAISKTVKWLDSSNAVVTVAAQSSPETSGGKTPKVLFLGSVCSAHGLQTQTVVNSLNDITTKGDVDYYLYSVNSTSSSTLSYSGSLKQNEKVSTTFGLRTSQHNVLPGFYARLYDVFSGSKSNAYDYIVFEFDGSRLAYDLPRACANEAFVSNCLKPYYENGQVLWIVDDDYPLTLEGRTFDFYPYWPNKTLCWKNEGEYEYLNLTQYKGLVGLLSPANYPPESVDTVCPSNKLQIGYSKSSQVEQFLRDTIKVRPYDLSYTDKIVNPAKGLTLQSVTVQGCTNGVDNVASTNNADWVSIITWDAISGHVTFHADTAAMIGVKGASMSVEDSTNLVHVCISNINFKIWTRFDSKVKDSGRFRTSEDAYFNPRTGKYEKNPNDGPVQVELIDESGAGIGVRGEAETEYPLDFLAFPVRGIVDNGEITIGHSSENPLGIGEGNSVSVFYRGWGGYKLVRLLMDDAVESIAEHPSVLLISNIRGEHTVRATYEEFIGSSWATPTTNVYDGVAHLFDVTIDYCDEAYSNEVRYAKSADAPDSEFLTKEEFVERYTGEEDVGVGSHTYAYRVYVKQPGYGVDESGFVDYTKPGWVWVEKNHGVTNVVITPRNLYIRPNNISFEQKDAPPELKPWHYQGVTATNYVARDAGSIHTDSSLFNFTTIGYSQSWGQYPIVITNAVGVTDDQIATKDYRIVYERGSVNIIGKPMQIGGVEQGPGLEPSLVDNQTGVDPVIKVYDGGSTSLTFRIDVPEGGEACGFHYRTGDEGEWQDVLPQFLNVGSNKVWYAIDDLRDPRVYFSVTNWQWVIINPRSVIVRADSATKVYNGVPLTASGSQVVSEYKLADGDEFVGVRTEGSQTYVGTHVNEIVESSLAVTNRTAKEDRTVDYVFTRETGMLEVTKAGMVICDVPQRDDGMPSEPGKSGVKDVDAIYNGMGTNIVVDVKLSDGSSNYEIMYSTNIAENVWVKDLAFTNVIDRQQVYFAVTDKSGNYWSVTNYAFVTIRPRPVTVKAKDQKMYVGDEPPPPVASCDDPGIGDFLDLPSDSLHYTNDVWTIGEYIGAIQTNEHARIAVTNATAGDVTFDYEISFVPGNLTITNRSELCVNAVGANKPYDGLPTNITFTVTNMLGEDITSFDGVWFKGEADADWIAKEVFEGYTSVTSTTVRVKVEVLGYDFGYGEATVTITEAGGTPLGPDDPVPSEGAWCRAADVEKVYDGQPTNITVRWGGFVPEGTEVTVRYALSEGGPYGDGNPTFADVTNATVWYAVPAPNYAAMTNSARVTITNRPVTVTFGAADKDYDGTAEATCAWTNFENVVEGESLALDTSPMAFAFSDGRVGEGKTVTATGYDDSLVSSGDGATKASNYSFSFVDTATASITACETPNSDDRRPGPHDPEHTGPFPGPNLPGGPKAPPAPNPNYVLSDYDVVTNYDGEVHTLNTNALFEVLKQMADTPVTEGGFGGNEYGVDYSLDGCVWTNEPYAWQHVLETPTSFWYRVSVTNMNPMIHAVGVTILPFGQDAHFTATLSWQFYNGTGSYYSYIKVTNTNDTDDIRYDPGTLRFCFADRVSASGTTLLALGDKVHRKNRWATTETIKGVTYRSYPLPDPAGGWTRGASKEYGTTGALSDSVLKNNPSPEMFVYKRIAPEWGNEEAAWATDFVAWLVWDWTDPSTRVTTTNAIPLLASKKGSGNVAVPKLALFEGGPVDVDDYNEILAFGNTAENVNLHAISFSFAGDMGVVKVGVADKTGGDVVPPGGNAEVSVLGATTVNGNFTNMGTLRTDENGKAEFRLGAKRFFKFSAKALEVVK